MSNNFPWDAHHPARVTIDPEHYQIHEGKVFYITLIPDTGGGFFTPGGGAGSSDLPVEWVLKPNSKYLIRCTNDSGVAAAIDFQVYWYEV